MNLLLLIAQLRIDLPRSLPDPPRKCEGASLYLKYGQYRFHRGAEIGFIYPLTRCKKPPKEQQENKRLELCLKVAELGKSSPLCDEVIFKSFASH